MYWFGRNGFQNIDIEHHQSEIGRRKSDHGYSKRDIGHHKIDNGYCKSDYEQWKSNYGYQIRENEHHYSTCWKLLDPIGHDPLIACLSVIK